MINPVVHLPSNEGEPLCAMSQSGNIIGSVEGPKAFIKAFDEHAENYIAACSSLSPPTFANNEAVGQKLHVDNVSFAVDTASPEVIVGGKAQLTARVLCSDNEVFAAIVRGVGGPRTFPSKMLSPCS